MIKLIKTHTAGCDFSVVLDADREITLLQLTDTQIIDESQSRTKERLGHDERTAWSRENIAKNCYNHIRSLVTQSNPDLIFFTGDVVYGSFDDSGEIFADFIRFMDSLEIPWTMVFGNHDNESKIVVAHQCEMLENSKYCLFKRGNVSGNSNFTIGIFCGEKLKRVLYMLDSNGRIADAAIHPDQLEYMCEFGESIHHEYGDIPGFMAFHIPVDIFHEAEYSKGYSSTEAPNYILGVDTAAKDGDFGFNREEAKYASPYIKTDSKFTEALSTCRIDGIFVGHCHKIATCINYHGMKLVFGLKTGQYDYHLEGQLGGTVITLMPDCDDFKVHYLPSLVPHGPFPAKGSVYTNDFFSGVIHMTNENKPCVAAVVGPTASGKTALAIALAKKFDGEVISCDSMQIYKGMDIGTAKPTATEMDGIPHHMIDIIEPSEIFSAADYAPLAKAAADDIISRGKLPIFCGGTGLYLDAVLTANSYAETETDPALRAELIADAERYGIDAMWERLNAVDPQSAAATHKNNVKRVIRALEIYLTSGVTKTEWDKRSRLAPTPYNSTIIALEREREELYRRIDLRVDMMMEIGLENEVRALLDSGRLPRNSTAAQAIGYKEFIAYFENQISLDDAVAMIKQSSRRYAKRQLTWFKRDKNVNWINSADNFEVIVNIAEKLLT